MEKLILTQYILQVLQEVYSNPGVKMFDIVRKYGISYPALNRIVKALCEKRLIIVKEEIIKERKKVKRLYPYIISCNHGIVVVPYIYFDEGKVKFVSLLVYNCPYYEKCSYKESCGLVEQCELLKTLPEELRNSILEYKKYVESLLGKSVEEIIK